ncbi:MAG: hypothetical protein K2I48_01905, partial [Muribaculaceae bacterium]|nr:hypothetical protein [Muribaculaceae bacterium]
MNREIAHNPGFIIPVRGSRSYRGILRKARDGEIVKVRNGVYATFDALAASMIDINAIVPGGTLCMYSAWHY